MENRAIFAVLLVLILSVSGCAKKQAENTNPNMTGFDSVSTDDELAQLPQAATPAQQTAVEALPIETSPVTQGAPLAARTAQTSTPAGTAAFQADIASLSRDKKIQLALKNAGYYQGNIDGKLGPASKRAIEAFQGNNGLKVDGKVGPKTWAALEMVLNGGAPQDAGAIPAQ